MKKIPIVLINWNYRGYIKGSLNSIFNQSYKNYEVIFIDNGSVDGSVEYVKKNYPKVRIIENKKNIGWTGWNNIGTKNLKSEHVVILGVATKADKDWLKELIRAAESDSKIGIVGSKIFSLRDPNRLWQAGGKFNFFTGTASHIGEDDIDRKRYDYIRDVDYVSGCCFLIKREVIDKIGPVDKDYFASYEDVDFCHKAKKCGYRVVCAPASKIWHKGRASDERVPAIRIYLDTRNRFVFMKKNAKAIHWLTFPFFYFVDVLGSMGINLIKGNFLAVDAVLNGVYDGIFKKRVNYSNIEKFSKNHPSKMSGMIG